MTKVNVFVFQAVTLLMVLIASSCASQTPPVVNPPPSPEPLTAIEAPRPVATPSPEDVEWEKIVQAARKEGHLIIYGFFLQGDVAEQVARAFREKTGIRLEIVSAAGTIFTERLKAERRGGLQVASILDGGSVDLQNTKQEGLTQAIGDLPVLREREVWRRKPAIDNERHIFTFAQGTLNPWINTSLVKAGTEPKSWRDLLQPNWKGKIGMVDPSLGSQPARIFQTLTRAGRLDEAYFTELGKQDIQWQPNIRHEAESLAKGQVHLIFGGSLSALSPYIAEGLPIKAIDMEEGVITYIMGGITLLDKAPHANAARVYLNWFMSKEGQYVFHQANRTYSVRKDVPNFELPQAQLTPKNPVEMTVEDMTAAARLQREGKVRRAIRGN